MKKILIAGGTGLIGRYLSEVLTKLGYETHILTRSPEKYEGSNYFKWDWKNGLIDERAFPVDGVINLAGEGIANKRWSKARKKSIIDSRVKSSEFLLTSLKKSQPNIDFYIGASAIGYYGDRPNESLNEESSAGSGFASECSVAWEKASMQWEGFAKNVSILRIGIVLAKNGGALEKMSIPLKVGVSNYFGNGKQIYSWIHIKDLVNMIVGLVQNPSAGIYNAVAPNPRSCKDFAKVLSSVSRSRSIVAPVPSFVLRATMGEMADILLDSVYVESKKIEKSGFQFEFTELEQALDDLLNAN